MSGLLNGATEGHTVRHLHRHVPCGRVYGDSSFNLLLFRERRISGFAPARCASRHSAAWPGRRRGPGHSGFATGIRLTGTEGPRCAPVAHGQVCREGGGPRSSTETERCSTISNAGRADGAGRPVPTAAADVEESRLASALVATRRASRSSSGTIRWAHRNGTRSSTACCSAESHRIGAAGRIRTTSPSSSSTRRQAPRTGSKLRAPSTRGSTRKASRSPRPR